jgi:hypothetical protein
VIHARHSSQDVKDGAAVSAEIATLDGTVSGDGVASVDWEANHDLNARLRVEVTVGDKKKSSRSVKYFVEATSDADAGAEFPEEEPTLNSDGVIGFIGDKVKLMAECQEMPDDAPIKFTLFLKGDSVDNAVASVMGKCFDQVASAEWNVEYHEEAELSFEAKTEYANVAAENSCAVRFEPEDDMGTMDEEPMDDLASAGGAGAAAGGGAAGGGGGDAFGGDDWAAATEASDAEDQKIAAAAGTDKTADDGAFDDAFAFDAGGGAPADGAQVAKADAASGDAAAGGDAFGDELAQADGDAAAGGEQVAQGDGGGDGTAT